MTGRMQWHKAKRRRSINAEHEFLDRRADRFLARADTSMPVSFGARCATCGKPASYNRVGAPRIKFCAAHVTGAPF